MLVAYRLVGLSALEAHYASIDASSQSAWARTLCPSFAGRTQEAPDALKGTQLTGRLKGLAVPFQALPMTPDARTLANAIFLPRRRCYAQTRRG